MAPIILTVRYACIIINYAASLKSSFISLMENW